MGLVFLLGGIKVRVRIRAFFKELLCCDYECLSLKCDSVDTRN